MYYHSKTVATSSMVCPMYLFRTNASLYSLPSKEPRGNHPIQYKTRTVFYSQQYTIDWRNQFCNTMEKKPKVLKISGVYFQILKPQSMCWWRESWYPYFLMQLVIRRWTSCLSSSSNMAPKYPMRLSVNFWEAMSLRHSNWKKKKEKELA